MSTQLGSALQWLSRRSSENALLLTALLMFSFVPVFSVGQTSPPAEQVAAVAATPAAVPDYVLQTGDDLEIRVANVPELAEVMKIRPDGRISLVRGQEVQAAGLTPKQLTDNITAAYGKYYRNPEVAVIVRTFTRQVVFVGGEVLNPGLLPMDRQLSLLTAVMQAGGTKRSAKMGQVILLRDSGQPGHPVTTLVNLSGIIHKGQPDIQLKPFDVVFIPKSKITKVDDFVDQYMKQAVPMSISTGFSYLFNATVVSTH